MFILSSAVKTEVLFFLANNSQYFCILHVASVCASCCNLLRVVGSCCAKFETCQTFDPPTPNTSFVPWSPKRSAKMLDPFCTVLRALLGPHTRITRGLLGFYKVVWLVFFPRCTGASNIVGNERNLMPQQRIFTVSLKKYPVILECDTELVRGYPSIG